MRKFICAVLCLGLLALAAILLPSSSGAKVQPVTKGKGTRPRFVPGEVLVRYRTESTAQKKTGRMMFATREGRQVSAQVERFDGSDLVQGLRLVRVAPGETLDAVAALRNQPDVLYAEPNYIMRAAVVPNDEHFTASRQYGLGKIGAQQVWDNFTTGSSSVVVGVIDQGIDITHQDLQPNIWTNPAPGSIPGITGDVNGYNFVDNNGTVFSNTDPETHASHVAGIIGAAGNNNLGVTGVNWTVRLMSLKFLDAEGFGDTVDAIRACNYAKQMRDLWVSSGNTQGANVRILNASFGGAAFTQSFLDSINALNTSGILFVAAAGNIENGTIEPNNDLVPHFPAGFNAPNVVAVAATNQTDNVSTFSHFGKTTVDLGAPGDSILSTTPNCTSPGPLCAPSFPIGATPTQDTYTFFSGTSMAAPHVAGSAALLWAHNPNLTVAQVKNLLIYNGDVQSALNEKSLTSRRLNVANSFQSLQETDNTAPGTPTAVQLNSQDGRNFNLRWTTAGDDGAGGGAAALYEINFVDGGTNAVIPLKGVVPAAPNTQQNALVTVPFRHTTGSLRIRVFDNKGNEGTPANLPVTIPLLAGDPYTTSVGAPDSALSTGGQRINIDGDDRYVDFLLPNGFTFPFFGSQFDELIISSNGNLFFSTPPRRIGLSPGNLDDADDPPGSPRTLGGYKMIAGLWEDLDLRVSERADAGVYVVQPSASRLIFRWQGVPCNFDGVECLGGAPVNFEIELNTNGTIKTRYGSGNTSLFPTVGIGGGDHEPYVITSHTSEETPVNLTNAQQATFTPRGSVQLASATLTVSEGAGTVSVTVNRNESSQAATVNFATNDTFNANCGQNNGQASANCDYNTSGATLRFAAGEASKTVTVSILDDGYVEGSETFTLTLNNAAGMSLGAPASVTITITDNDATPSNPFNGNAFFVRQQYLDFLLREPDQGGFNDWLNVLNNCAPNQGGLGSNPACDRVHVSSGFFRSTEFGERGYWSYRYYHATLGRRPQFAEFVPDMRRLSGFLSPAEEEAQRAAFVADFMARPEFTTIYAGLTNAANAAPFIAKLEQTAGVTLPATTTTQPGQPPQFGRQELINKMQSGEFTAAQTLRAFIEQKVVFDAFFFRAFVAMQYFGYLLRDPEDAGYNDWVDVLTNGRDNIQPGDFRHLIFGFVWSVEYRQRFGPP
ncbi:MAG TPA: S8 family serine peptidase [Pyrinomonadaceae bacterium]|nr:S8 family serine peptidase [Pyrinomonadaceae bacterium]